MKLNRVVQGDCLVLLRHLSETNTRFDLVLTDPPYNVGKDFGNETDRQHDCDFAFFLSQRLGACVDLMGPKSSMVAFCSHKYVPMLRSGIEGDVHYQRMLIWHYRNGMSRQTDGPVTEYEPFIWFTRDEKEWTYNGDDIRVPYRSERVKNPVYKKNKAGEMVAWRPDPRGAKRGDVWEYPALAGALYKKERTAHPTQKPESLITDIIKAFCPKGEDGMYEGNVLDPFGGSGTTAACCEKLNQQGHRINWLLMELEPKWVETIEDRLAQIKAEAPIL